MSIRLTAVAISLLLFTSVSFGQAPAGTTFTWLAMNLPRVHTSPTFAVSTTDATKTSLTSAEGTVDFGNGGGKQFQVTKVTLVILVDAGGGVLNPVLRENGAKNLIAPNKWSISGTDFSTPLKQFDPAVNIRIEFEIEFKEAPTQLNPNPATLTATVGSKTIKPTVP